MFIELSNTQAKHVLKKLDGKKCSWCLGVRKTINKHLPQPPFSAVCKCGALIDLKSGYFFDGRAMRCNNCHETVAILANITKKRGGVLG